MQLVSLDHRATKARLLQGYDIYDIHQPCCKLVLCDGRFRYRFGPEHETMCVAGGVSTVRYARTRTP